MGLHYMACIEKPYTFMECGIEEYPWELDCYDQHIEIKDGRAKVPVEPGWGFEPSAEFLARAKYEITEKTDFTDISASQDHGWGRDT